MAYPTNYQVDKLQFALLIRGVKTIVLENAPSGWEKALLQVQRSQKYYGTMTTFSVPMDFVTTGANALRIEFYNYGIQADVRLIVNYLDDLTQTYKPIVVGGFPIDFSNITDNGRSDAYKFTANVLSDDITALIDKFGDATFEIPLPVPEAVPIQLQGIALVETASFNFDTNSNFESFCFPGLSVTDNKVNSIYPSVQQVPQLTQANPDWENSGQWFIRARLATTVQINGNMGVSLAPGPGSANEHHFAIQFRRSSDGSIVKTIFDQTVYVTSQFNFTWNFTCQLGTFEELFVYFYSYGTDPQKGFNVQYGTMNLQYYTISPPSIVNVLPPMYIFQQLVNRIYQMQYNGASFPCISYLLSQSGWNQLMITSGDAFRRGLVDYQYFDAGLDQLTPGNLYTVVNGIGLTGGTVQYNSHTYNIGDSFIALATKIDFASTGGALLEFGYNPASVKTSFNDFFKSINAVLNVGLGLQNGKLYLEQKSYFFNQNIQTAKLADIKTFKLSPYVNYLFNTISGGYPDQTYDVVNGRSEVCSEVEYTAPVLRIKKELDLKSVYRSDPYGMEFLRIVEGNNTTNGDNAVFFIKILNIPLRGVPYLMPEVYPSYTGVDAGYFNFAITPKRNLLRHADYLAGCLLKVEGQILVSSATKSLALTSVDDLGVFVSEAAPIDISTLGAPLFYPYQVDIDSDLPDNTLQALTMFPNGRIDFFKDGNTYMGFPLTAQVDPAKNTERNFSLLLTAQNDLTTLAGVNM